MKYGMVNGLRFMYFRSHDSEKVRLAEGVLAYLCRQCEALSPYFMQGTKEMCLTVALPSVLVSVESGCWTEGQGAGPVKY